MALETRPSPRQTANTILLQITISEIICFLCHYLGYPPPHSGILFLADVANRGCLSKRSWSFLKKSVALTCHYCPTIVESAVLVCFLLGGDLAAGLTTPRTGLVRVGPCWGNLRSRWREYSSFLLCKPLDQRWFFDSDEDWGLWRAHWVENYWSAIQAAQNYCIKIQFVQSIC
jgi:hypothetical protein